MDDWVLWLIAAGLFAAGEVASLDLVLLMFAGGALAGTAVALIGLALPFQLLAFALVSVALLTVVRPLARRQLEASTPLTAIGTATLVGRTAKVTRPVDRHSGRIKLGADEWSACTQHGGETFEVGDTVRILEIRGATAVVGDAFE